MDSPEGWPEGKEDDPFTRSDVDEIFSTDSDATALRSWELPGCDANETSRSEAWAVKGLVIRFAKATTIISDAEPRRSFVPRSESSSENGPIE